MLVKYYKDNDLSYASRKRHKTISNFTPIGSETQKSILLGDGARTYVKTSVNNICDYVTIDDTRWFVTDYIYLNGKQVQLNLQRDVIGEIGVKDCYGKIERGYTNGILKYRKELSVNEILKRRIPLIPTNDTYFNFSVDNHEKEMWGILYFTKDSTQDKVNINIPAFSPVYVTKTAIPNNSTYLLKQNYKVSQSFYVFAKSVGSSAYFYCSIGYEIKDDYWAVKNVHVSYVGNYVGVENVITFSFITSSNSTFEELFDATKRICNNIIAKRTIEKYNVGFSFPANSDIEDIGYDYTGKIVKDGNNYYSYSSITNIDIKNNKYGKIDKSQFVKYFTSIGGISVDNKTFYIRSVDDGIDYLSLISENEVTTITYTRTELSPTEVGAITIDMTTQLVDEPYSILAFPLYDVTIKDERTNETYKIDRDNAFMVFNEVISGLSGENGFLVDAQIYPYCPDLNEKQTEIIVKENGEDKSIGYPFFSIVGTTFYRDCEVQLRPYNDVKKEYITRNYSIVSPDQSSKFTFNYYDYINKFVGNGEFNEYVMNISIKTALKPFAIISSAVIQKTENSISGINYASDLRGSQPSSNGFECSLSSDAFETYKRQNSNYQALFDLEKQELSVSQTVERVNEKTQGIWNTLSMTAFGAIAGGAMADFEIFGNSARGAGAIAGAASFGAVTAGANLVQYAGNELLRNYEKKLQQKRFDLEIGTIKNLPNSVNRISSFNEIIMQDFYYVLEVYECTDEEKTIVDNFIQQYGYGIGVYDFIVNYVRSGWFIKADVIKSNLITALHEVVANDLAGGVYIYE